MISKTSEQAEMNDDAVQPIAWAVNDFPDESRYVYALRMPNEWRDAIGGLEKIDEVSPPTDSLHNTLPGLAPEIIHIFWPFHKDPQKRPEYWLVAESPQDPNDAIDSTKLAQVIKGWLITCYGSQRAGSVSKIIDAYKPVWEAVDLQEAPRAFRQEVLPGLAARYLLRHGFQFILRDIAGNPATWPVFLTTGSYGDSELITEVIEGRSYSYYLQFSTYTLPGSETIYLLCRTGIRRWVNQPVKAASGYINLVFNRSKSVYVQRKSIKFLTRQALRTSYLRLRVRRRGKEVLWDGRQHQVLKDLSATGQIPELDDLLTDPVHYQPHVLIVYDNFMGLPHSIQPGLESADHYEVFSHLAEALPFDAMPLWTKVDVRKRINHSYAAEETYRDKDRNIVIPALIRQAALRRILPARIETNINDFSRLRSAILDIVGLSELKDSALDRFRLPNWSDHEVLEITRPQLDSRLFEELSEVAMSDPESAKIAESRRAKEVAAELAKVATANVNTGFLVEMNNFREKYGKDTRYARRDPKRAVRWGLAKAHRVSQNLVPESDDDEYVEDELEDGDYELRLQNACRDLLRQMGFMLNPLYSKFKQTFLSSELDLFGFWVIQHNARHWGEKKRIVPVAIYAPSKQARLFVCLPEGNGIQWLSYTDALKRAVEFDLDVQNGGGYPDYDEAAVRSFFNAAIRRRLHLERDALLLLSAQNLRRFIPDLDSQNDWQLREHLTLNGIITSDMKNLRLACLHSSSNGTAPQVCPPKNRSKYSGLYTHPAFVRVFYSVQRLPDHKNKGWRQRDREEDFARNPSTLEIALYNLQKIDEPEDWAWLVHRLREESSHINIPTMQPEPLHSLKKVSEYVLQVVNDEL